MYQVFRVLNCKICKWTVNIASKNFHNCDIFETTLARKGYHKTIPNVIICSLTNMIAVLVSLEWAIKSLKSKFKSESRNLITSKMEIIGTLVNNVQQLTSVIKTSILDVVGVLDLPSESFKNYHTWNFKLFWHSFHTFIFSITISIQRQCNIPKTLLFSPHGYKLRKIEKSFNILMFQLFLYFLKRRPQISNILVKKMIFNSKKLDKSWTFPTFLLFIGIGEYRPAF